MKQRVLHQRLAPIAMEPRGVLARYFPGEEELTLWSSTQIPHLMRTQVALMIGMPENKLRVITPEVGGGFGSKLNVYAEEALLGWISIQLSKPVKWIETRRENIQATIHGRGQIGDIEIAFKNDGTLTGLRYSVFADLGAYHQLLTPAIPTLTGLMLSGAYKIPAIQMNITALLHEQDGHRRLSRRGPSGSDVRRRTRTRSGRRWISEWIPRKFGARTSLPRTSFRFTPRPVSTTTAATTKPLSTKLSRSPVTQSFAKNRRRLARKDV